MRGVGGAVRSITCTRCGVEFQTHWNRQKFCSFLCRKGERTCLVCGVTFAHGGNTTGNYCSKKCWYSWYAEHGKYPKTCPACGGGFHGPYQTCSMNCRKELVRSRYPDRRFDCETCHGPLRKWARPHTRFCSQRCSNTRSRVVRTRGAPLGSRRDHGGYIQVKTENGWELEHRVVMAQTLGRPLELHERIHHKNGNKAHNEQSNLELWKLTKKDPSGVRAADYHCHGCRCFEGRE